MEQPMIMDNPPILTIVPLKSFLFSYRSITPYLKPILRIGDIAKFDIKIEKINTIKLLLSKISNISELYIFDNIKINIQNKYY